MSVMKTQHLRGGSIVGTENIDGTGSQANQYYFYSEASIEFKGYPHQSRSPKLASRNQKIPNLLAAGR